MKVTSATILLALAACAVAAPFESWHSARGETTDVEFIVARAADIAAELHELLARAAPLGELEARGGTHSSNAALQIVFKGTGSDDRKKKATKELKNFLTKEEQKSHPYCTIEFSATKPTATFRCFSSSSKKLTEQGPAGAINLK
ncbi:hypothetical protein DXG03_005851 [Asterophora parasitica]|uniref:Uncharacterized protein n=1 Tax=Asterophora parasitica TaxID=117018 RepID=A0A9P7K9Q6_9AGAR|nr:hypothetical protein DXG03_005851 [Asterophora parasitica]